MNVEQLRQLEQAARRHRGQMTVIERVHYGMPEPGGFVGERTGWVVIEPSTLAALLDIAEVAQAAVDISQDDSVAPHTRCLGCNFKLHGCVCAYGDLRDALARLEGGS